MTVKLTSKLTPTKSIKPHPKNPRKIASAVQAVAKSIQDFGFLVPVVLNKDNVLLAGHVRFEAAKYLGLDKIPAVKAENLTEEQQKAFMIADNRVADNAVFDMDMLGDIIQELEDSNFDLSSTGFDEEELESILTSNTSALDDIMGEKDSDESKKDDLPDDKGDARNLHRLMFLANEEQKTLIHNAIEAVKEEAKEQEEVLSNAEALARICDNYTQTGGDFE